jgi:hypothetical protein
MNIIKAMAKEQGVMPVNNNLEEKFNNKQQAAQQQLNFAQQEITDQYNYRVSKHKQRAKEIFNEEES